MKWNSQSVSDRLQAQAQPIVRVNRRRQWLSRTCLHPREHEGACVRVRAPRRPQVNRLAHGLGDRDQAVIGASIAVLALDFLAPQPPTPRAIHDTFRRGDVGMLHEQCVHCATSGWLSPAWDR